MKKLLTRTISGIIFVFIVIEGTLWTTWSFYALWTLIGLLCLNEYYTLLRQPKAPVATPRSYILGTFYILLPIVLVMTMQPEMVITILTIVWINDTGAFIVGSLLGKHKMAPKISPKKSWEGFFGGVAFAVFASYLWYALYWSDTQRTIAPLFSDATTSTILWCVFGLMIAIAAVLGDLIESKLKRTVGVKDSGNLIPGHGGILDRFDATLLAIPVAWFFATFIL